MATKITVSKALEKKIRAGDEGVVGAIVALLDAAQSKVVTPALPVSEFLSEIEAHRQVVKPPPGPIAARTYSRLAKVLQQLGITRDQASALGLWLAGQRWIVEVTVDRMITNLGDWVTRAMANKPEFNRPVWEDR